MDAINNLFSKLLSILPIIMVVVGIALLLLCGEVLENYWEFASITGVLMIVGGVLCHGFNTIVKAAQKYLDQNK